MTAAHQQALPAAIAVIDLPACQPDPLCVNLLGTSIYQRHWQACGSCSPRWVFSSARRWAPAQRDPAN